MNYSTKNIIIFVTVLVVPLILTYLVYYFLLNKLFNDWQTLVATYATSVWLILFISSFFENNIANILNNTTSYVNLNFNQPQGQPQGQPNSQSQSIVVSLPATFSNGPAVIDNNAHTYQFVINQSQQGLMTEVNPVNQPSALAIYNNNGTVYGVILPVVNGQIMTEVAGTSLNGSSCSAGWACGNIVLTSVFSANTANAIGTYSTPATFNGQIILPNQSTGSHGATVVSGQL